MQNRIISIAIMVVSLSAAVFNTSCDKDDGLQDPADKYVGDYTYVLETFGGIAGKVTGDLTIVKTATDKVVAKQAGAGDTHYTVVGETIVEDEGQTVEISISATETDTFTESSHGSLVGNVLTINGWWTRITPPGMTYIFTVVCTKK